MVRRGVFSYGCAKTRGGCGPDRQIRTAQGIGVQEKSQGPVKVTCWLRLLFHRSTPQFVRVFSNVMPAASTLAPKHLCTHRQHPFLGTKRMDPRIRGVTCRLLELRLVQKDFDRALLYWAGFGGIIRLSAGYDT